MESNKKSILIVDDIIENINLLQNILQESDYITYASTNGNKAVDMCMDIEFDLMLIDVRMPEIDGFETYRKIRDLSKNNIAPVLFMVAKTDTENITAAFKEGCVDIITKPFQTEEFLARINTHLTIQSQKKNLRELNATKDRFISILAHDLKNPFNAILGFLVLLMKNLNEYNIQEIKKYLEIIYNTSKNTYGLLINLLEWASLQQNRIMFNPKKNNLYVIVNQCYLLVNSSAISKGIVINIEVDESICVFADEEMIKTILRNLITNAIKFTPVSGVVTICAKLDQPFVEIVVSDTGVGMDEKTIKSLFKIVETKSTKGTEGESGTGFGLILCKEFVEKNSGNIWVESELGIGSVVKFTLPLCNV